MINKHQPLIKYVFVEVPVIQRRQVETCFGTGFEFLYSVDIDGIQFINLGFNPLKYRGRTKIITLVEPIE